LRRLLSQDIYTVKLVGRGRFVPKAPHANMFLVRHVHEVMEADVVVVPAELRGAGDVIGVISKEHIADSVADSIRPYGG
jgi:hypothetical protein